MLTRLFVSRNTHLFAHFAHHLSAILGIFRPENEWTRQAHLEKNTGTKAGNYTDGSIESDLPMQQLSELFNVNHFIVSQVGN